MFSEISSEEEYLKKMKLLFVREFNIVFLLGCKSCLLLLANSSYSSFKVSFNDSNLYQLFFFLGGH